MYGIRTKQNIYILSYTIKPKTSQQKEKREKKTYVRTHKTNKIKQKKISISKRAKESKKQTTAAKTTKKEEMTA